MNAYQWVIIKKGLLLLVRGMYLLVQSSDARHDVDADKFGLECIEFERELR